MTSKRLTEKNTKTPKSVVSSQTALRSLPNRESLKFTSLSCLKRFRNAFIMMPPRATHTPPSKLPVRMLFTSSERKQNDNEPKKERSNGTNIQRQRLFRQHICQLNKLARHGG